MEIKKQYVPARYRSPKLTSGGAAGVGTMLPQPTVSGTPSGHIHDNKEVVDQLTEKAIRILSHFDIDENGILHAIDDFYSKGELSAYGAGAGGGGSGGGIIEEVLDASYFGQYLDPVDYTKTFNAHAINSINDKVGRVAETVENMETDKQYKYSQGMPSTVWFITHNLGKRPSVTVVDSAGSVVEGQVEYLDNNNVRVSFAYEFSGEAYLN
ncbi:hypothetical protein [Bacteroides sedimenti]|uniref:EF-hand domain-containing protein n=1 Tax=Bacteroides sedimenti TaxID=2136147 RepID=A0ABN6Z1T6_9BACE